MASLLEDEVDSLATELEIVKSEEKRIEALRATASRVAPLNEADTRELITITAVEYDVDPILAIAISRLETGNWKSGLCTSQYNYGGMVGSGPHGFAAYSTPAEGINAFCKLLAWYKQNGMDTAQKMASTYCPGNADGWTAKVMELYTQEK